ncbi:MAG: ABC transporter permease, partial [Gammaproteobacteria bacterium]|nr:ABC transporter permease [Gammaproteobacteria bacterium]
KKQIRTALISEFLVLGLIAGMIAAVSASLQAFMIAERVLHMDYYVNVWVLLLAPLIGAVGVAIAGLLGNRSVVQRPPLQTIRSLQ